MRKVFCFCKYTEGIWLIGCPQLNLELYAHENLRQLTYYEIKNSISSGTPLAVWYSPSILFKYIITKSLMTVSKDFLIFTIRV